MVSRDLAGKLVNEFFQEGSELKKYDFKKHLRKLSISSLVKSDKKQNF